MTSASFILTLSSGHSLDLSDPRPQDIRVEDIAAALAKICRFGAQPTSFYSVAQHAVGDLVLVVGSSHDAASVEDGHKAPADRPAERTDWWSHARKDLFSTRKCRATWGIRWALRDPSN